MGGWGQSVMTGCWCTPASNVGALASKLTVFGDRACEEVMKVAQTPMGGAVSHQDPGAGGHREAAVGEPGWSSPATRVAVP